MLPTLPVNSVYLTKLPVIEEGNRAFGWVMLQNACLKPQLLGWTFHFLFVVLAYYKGIALQAWNGNGEMLLKCEQ